MTGSLGLTPAELAETHPCRCCGEPMGGSIWESADGTCWDCWHGCEPLGACTDGT